MDAKKTKFISTTKQNARDIKEPGGKPILQNELRARIDLSYIDPKNIFDVRGIENNNHPE